MSSLQLAKSVAARCGNKGFWEKCDSGGLLAGFLFLVLRLSISLRQTFEGDFLFLLMLKRPEWECNQQPEIAACGVDVECDCS